MNIKKIIVRITKSLFFLGVTSIINKLLCKRPNAIMFVVIGRKNFLSWLVSDASVRDRVTYKALKENGFCVSVKTDIECFNKYSSNHKLDLIWINPYRKMFIGDKSDLPFVEKLSCLISSIEDCAQFVYPRSYDVLFWENKKYMHEFMENNLLRHPKTTYINSIDLDELASIEYPCIIKSLAGYSSNGIWLVRNSDELKSIFINATTGLLIQEFLNIKFDIRVICVFGEVVSFYWRINDISEEWRPTATKNGSTVQFIQLPIAVENLAKDIYNKSGCVSFGADICFKNDDETSDPYILEFSPVYQPNPVPNNGVVTTNYSKFKNGSLSNYESKFESLCYFISNSILLGARKRIIRNAP